jgi:predicted phosphoribosyltransferase
MYRDRTEAGQQLAAALKQFRPDRPLVLGLPRGGVVVAAEVAQRLDGDLDVLLVKKLRAPDNPELAIGALSEEGDPFLNQELVALTGSDRRYVDREIAERRAEIDQQRQQYRAVKPRLPTAGRVVILVDDGLATGATMIAAAQATGLAKPKKLIIAVPVGASDAVEYLGRMREVDEVVCLHTPSWFNGVGQFYEDFSQVSDDEVVAVLAGNLGGR